MQFWIMVGVLTILSVTGVVVWRILWKVHKEESGGK